MYKLSRHVLLRILLQCVHSRHVYYRKERDRSMFPVLPETLRLWRVEFTLNISDIQHAPYVPRLLLEISCKHQHSYLIGGSISFQIINTGKIDTQ